MKLRTELPEFPDNLKWLNGHVKKERIIGEVPLLIHFWSVSCNLCKGASETLNKWRSLYDDKFKIVSIHMPLTEEDVDVRLIRESANQLKITNPIYLDHDLILTKTFQNRYVPAYYLFDKKGLLRHYQSGENGMRMLEKRLNFLINERKR
ncbi:TlpA family protein disulfide reductase [Psychrobacillus vulpis]|uniref:TlpA family protein disulfide reductase n=1 Tax=Psychrobacillus vulpis TaxID=2325572 RepID=A0A544TRS7_9BACI|nr:TlpA family protein disulfide reductase [Psychrobacillus vulpis]TQR20153.1 TlpA family protein disulfide reductase [Psychrobacillus vulpis]